MKDVLEYILKNITTMPDEVVIEEREEEGGTNYIISVNAADVGRIIGKEGKVIKAIRTIMRVIAIQKGVRVRVSVLSDDNNAPAPAAAQAQDDVTIVDNSAPAVADEAEITETPEVAAEPVVVPEEKNSDELTVEV